jgi:hypothetical protein
MQIHVKAGCVRMVMASCRLWFWPQSLVLAVGLVLVKSLVLATGFGSGYRVWFWLQSLVLAEGLTLAEVFYIFYKLLILVISNNFIIYILIYLVFQS